MDGLCDNEALGSDMLETSHSSGRSTDSKTRNNYKEVLCLFSCHFAAVCRWFAKLCGSLGSMFGPLAPFMTIFRDFIHICPFTVFLCVFVPLLGFCTTFSHFASLYVCVLFCVFAIILYHPLVALYLSVWFSSLCGCSVFICGCLASLCSNITCP